MQTQPPPNIDPSFSVFHSLKGSDAPTALRHRKTMQLVSFTIENATIKDRVRARIFAGFQRMSKFLRQLARYNELSLNAEMVYVFGVPDVPVPAIPNVTYVPLKATDQLAKEWFLISYAQDYQSALATEELTRIEDPDHLRMFKGLWTFNPDLVTHLHDQLTAVVSAPAPTFNAAARGSEKQVALMSQTVDRLTRRLGKVTDQVNSLLNTELSTAIKNSVDPMIAALTGSITSAPREQEAIVLFSDIRDFTALSESMLPSQLVELVLTPYFQTVSEIVAQRGGKIDKFLGDGVLAVFGLDETGGVADPALAAAIEIIQSTARQNLTVGVGLSAGPVMVSTLNTGHYSETTVIGATVNHAQRLSEEARNEVWVNDSLYARLVNRDGLQPGGEVTFKGLAKPMTVYKRLVR